MVKAEINNLFLVYFYGSVKKHKYTLNAISKLKLCKGQESIFEKARCFEMKTFVSPNLKLELEYIFIIKLPKHRRSSMWTQSRVDSFTILLEAILYLMLEPGEVGYSSH